MCPSYMYKCEPCDKLISEIVSYDNRDVPQECPECTGEALRTYEGHTINNTRASFVSGTKRFDTLRNVSKLRKLKAEARAKGDLATSDQITKEQKEISKC